METEQSDNFVLEFFKAFSNLERLKIAGLLASDTLTPGQVAERLGMSTKDAANNLDYLAHWGYLKQQGNAYHLDKEAWMAMSRRVLEHSRPRSSTEDFAGEDFERKVLKDYIGPDGRLSAVPTQQKKRLVIMRYLQQSFEPGVRYPEKQVNELLKRFNPDTASLRRYLIDDGLMQREGGLYWRVESQEK